jgi:hypothetical protein
MLWKIYAREASGIEDSEEYAAECYSSGVIAVGWSEIGDLNKIASRPELKKRIAQQGWSKGKNVIAQWAGALWRFRTEVKKGDMVICPDRDSNRFYVGRILSEKAFFDLTPLGGKCHFAHRRKVRWKQVLCLDDIRSIWPNGNFGGLQTVSLVKGGSDRFQRFMKRFRRAKVRSRRGHLPVQPDMEWGRAAEERAMQWLKDKGRKPQDVADRHLGWDISCGDEMFEVKGRKSAKTVIRLTQNEWNAAKKHGKKFTILLFTAPNREKLKVATPVKIPDPTNTREWNRRAIYEYLLDE